MQSTIISAVLAAEHLNDPDWIFLDVQFDLMNPAAGRSTYAQTHIPGALFIDLETELSGKKTGNNGRHPLPSVEALQALFASLGISKGKQIVLYDASCNMYSARAWWLLRWLGFDAAAVLDGGLGYWRKKELPVVSGEVARPDTPGLFEAKPISQRLWFWQDVMNHLQIQEASSPYCLVDARAPERFSGKDEPIDPVAGHIPGAVNHFWKDGLDAEGCFLPPAVLRERFLSSLPSLEGKRVVHQCGSGVTACHNVLAFELAGLGDSILYAGSWSEWCSDLTRPVVSYQSN